jgi:hypothetical protein
VFVALQNSVPVGGRFLSGLHTLQNNASDEGFFGAAQGKALQHSENDICSVEF